MLPSPGTVCNDITETVFGNQTTPMKRTLDHDLLEEQMLEAGKALSQTRFPHPFGVSV